MRTNWYKCTIPKVHWYGKQIRCGPFHSLSMPILSLPSMMMIMLMLMLMVLHRNHWWDSWLLCYPCWYSQVSRQYCLRLMVRRYQCFHGVHCVQRICTRTKGNYSNSNHYAMYTVNRQWPFFFSFSIDSTHEFPTQKHPECK